MRLFLEQQIADSFYKECMQQMLASFWLLTVVEKLLRYLPSSHVHAQTSKDRRLVKARSCQNATFFLIAVLTSVALAFVAWVRWE